MSFTSAAQTVVARLFKLVDSNNRTVAEFGQLTSGGFTQPVWQIAFHHLNAATVDSALVWSIDPTNTTQSIYLYGPASNGGNVSAPYLQLQKTAIQSGIWMEAEYLTGGHAGLALQANNTTGPEAYIQVTNYSTLKTNTVDLTPTTTTLTSDTVNVAPAVGLQLSGRAGYVLTSAASANNTAAVSPPNATFTDITGASVTIPVAIGDIVELTGFFDISVITNVAGVGVGAINFNGAVIGQPCIVGVSTATSFTRATTMCTVLFTSTVTGNIIAKLQGRLGTGAPVGVTFGLGNCVITAKVFSTK